MSDKVRDELELDRLFKRLRAELLFGARGTRARMVGSQPVEAMGIGGGALSGVSLRLSWILRDTFT